MNEQTYIFTFGLGTLLRNNFVKIKTNSMGAARDIMFEHYGENWAFGYPTEDAAGVSEYHLSEVPLGTPNERL